MVNYTGHSTQLRVKLTDIQRCLRARNLNEVNGKSEITVILQFQVKTKVSSLQLSFATHNTPESTHYHLKSKPLNLHSIMYDKSTEYKMIPYCKFHVLSYIRTSGEKKANLAKL